MSETRPDCMDRDGGQRVWSGSWRLHKGDRGGALSRADPSGRMERRTNIKVSFIPWIYQSEALEGSNQIDDDGGIDYQVGISK